MPSQIYFTQKGFTLIEMLVTIVIASILLAIGVPSYQRLVADNRSLTQANELVTSLNLARSLAIKKHRDVTICASQDQIICNIDANVSDVPAAERNNWEEGWIILISGDANISHQVLGYGGSNTARGINFANAAAGQLTFDRLGNTNNPGSIVVCDYRGATSARVVLVGASGFAREGTIASSNNVNIIDDDMGNDISCP